MKRLMLLLIIFCVCSSIQAIDKISTDSKLALSERHLTTNVGILLPAEIIRLEPNDEIKIYLPDGTLFRGTITKAILKEKYHFECFGELHTIQNAGFGFVVTKDGIFGAIVMRDTDTIYHVKYSAEANGYILLKRVTPSIIL